MKILIICLAGAVASSGMPAARDRARRSDPVLVRSVVDGDTIAVDGLGKVRLLGIDAPEISHGLDTSAPFGREARDRLASLVLHRFVRLETDGPQLDAYHRRLAYVMTEDGQFVNALLVRDGLARVSTREPLVRLGELKRAESEAQSARRGMWRGAPPIESATARAANGKRARAPSTRTGSRRRSSAAAGDRSPRQ
jgi:micrococcal nuclease